jgi:hypothetical protein
MYQAMGYNYEQAALGTPMFVRFEVYEAMHLGADSGKNILLINFYQKKALYIELWFIISTLIR